MAEVDTLTVLDANEVPREVPTLLSLEARFGEVQASPTSNTLLDRLKAIATNLANATGLTGSGTEVGAARVTLANDRLGAVLSVTPVMDTAAYASNDVAFIPIEIAGFAHHANGVAHIDSINIIDEDDQGVALDLYFNNANSTMGNLNAPFAPSDANARAIKGKFQIAAADWQDLGGVRHACFDNVGVKVKADGNGSIWLVGAIRSGTPTFTASGLKIDIGVTWC